MWYRCFDQIAVEPSFRAQPRYNVKAIGLPTERTAATDRWDCRQS